MKKILAILLTVAMLFSVAAISASAAETDVAAIGEATYATLADAITAAEAGDTITLMDDVTENVTIGKNITLDGADKQYTGKITLTNAGATIQNVNFVNGQIFKHKNTGAALKITVKNCDFKGYVAEDQYAINLGLANAAIIENCTAKDVGFGFLYIPSAIDDVTVKNVNIDGASYGIHIVYNTKTTIENVTIKNAYVGIMDQSYAAKTITFKDCKVDATYPVAIWERSATTQTFEFKGNNDFGTADLTFGSSLVKVDAEVAELNGTVYKSLQAAIDACVSGNNTIELLIDCDETVTVKQTEGVNIVIDGNDKKYSGTIKVDGNNRLNGAETLTIKNFNFENAISGTYSYFINAEKNAKGKNSEAHNLTVDSCTFKGTNWQYAIATRTPNNLVVKNCTAENVYYLLYNPQGGEKITVEDCTVTASNYGIGSQKCKNTYIKNFTFNGYYTGIYGRSSSNDSTITMENIDITSSHGNSITLWANNDKDTSKTFKFIFKGNIKITAPESLTWFASQSVTNSPYVFGAKCTVDETGNTFKFIHTPGAESTCMTAQTCTVCGEELAPTTDHVLGDYVSDDNATCTADGTKTAECIYGCGEKDTVADEGSMKPHTPGDAATCMAAQTCTGCGVELDAIKDHEFGEYVSDGNATCKENGTKTAECIYGCGLKDTVTDKGSATGHKDADGNGRCDDCDAKFCDTCGKVHDDWMSMLFCLIVDFVNLVISFFSSVK